MTELFFHRGRRLRRTPQLRELVRETQVTASDLIMPYFVVDTDNSELREEIRSMPGQYQFSLQELEKEIGEAYNKGLRAVLLFGIPKTKDPLGTGAYDEEGIVQRAVRMIKKNWAEMIVITDLCLCEYTSHGHCGIIADGDTTGHVLNDPTLELLQKTAVSQAKAGADIIAPSDMMDGRICAIRSALDKAGFEELPIMSYAVKYASSYYGPFRDAADSAPHFGDRRTYQMDCANAREAIREIQADIEEGADLFIIKPAGPYQDIIRLVRDRFEEIPLVGYQVSGEYSLICAAAQNNWINREAVIKESLLGIKRAGAKMIITYFAAEVLSKGWV